MKLLLYIVILASVILFPVAGTDVGELLPVEVVAISEEDGIVTIRTDTEDSGQGTRLQAAIADLKAGAAGVIYLDTAEYLLLEEGMESWLDTIERHLKRSVQVCHAREGISLEGIANFLSVHGSNVTLGTVSNTSKIPIVAEENGRYHLIEK